MRVFIDIFLWPLTIFIFEKFRESLVFTNGRALIAKGIEGVL